MMEPLKVNDALEDPDWLIAMQEELNNFKRNDVWTLMKHPDHCRNVIGTKWVFKNKQDEHDIVIRSKARLVVQGFSSRRHGLWRDICTRCEARVHPYPFGLCHSLWFQTPTNARKECFS
jgi:hypothetical protein